MLINISNTRGREQEDRMNMAEKSNICPFCKEGLEKIHKLPIEKETENFFATKNAFPYEGTNIHYLIISKKHIYKIEEILESDWEEIKILFKWILESTNISGGSMFFRFGDIFMTGSSIQHFHIQIISGTANEKDEKDKRESIKVKLGYKKI